MHLNTPTPTKAPAENISPTERGRTSTISLWISGFAVLAALVLVVLKFGELKHFVRLLNQARPWWLAVGFLLQLITYLCAAAVWHRCLKHSGHPVSLRSLYPLGLAKLFTDQALPSGGLSGSAVIVSSLMRRGVPPHLVMGSLLVGLVSFFASYLIMVLATVLLLWLHHEIHPVFLAITAIFSIAAVGIPLGILWVKNRTTRPIPQIILRVPGTRFLLDAISQAPEGLFRDFPLVIQSTALQSMVFLLDAGTLWAMLLAIGQPAGFSVAFPAFIAASVVTTVGPVPLGLGTFEATCVATQHMLGVPVEAALTATLLLRGVTFWIPMLPGSWLARRAVRIEKSAQGSQIDFWI